MGMSGSGNRGSLRALKLRGSESLGPASLLNDIDSHNHLTCWTIGENGVCLKELLEKGIWRLLGIRNVTHGTSYYNVRDPRKNIPKARRSIRTDPEFVT